MKTLKELQKDYELALSKAKEENEQNEKKVFDFLQTMTEKRLIVKSELEVNKSDISVYFATDDTTEKTDFCSSFSMAYKSKYNSKERKYEKPELAMDCGSSGLTTRAEEPYKVERWHLMSRIWDHEKEFTDLLDSLDYTKQKLADQAYKAFEDETDRIEDEKDAKVNAKVNSLIKVGAIIDETTYTEKYDSNSCKYEKVVYYTTTYKITKLTPKRAYVEYTTKVPREKRKYADATSNYKFLGVSIGYDKNTYSGYLSLIQLKTHLFAKQTGDKADFYGMDIYCSGVSEIAGEFVEESFKPAN